MKTRTRTSLIVHCGGTIVAHRAMHRRRGSIYVVVLGASTAIAVIGLAGVTALRIHRRSVDDTLDFAQARLYAQSALNIGAFRIQEDPDWRTALANDDWKTDQAIGSGTYTLEGVDPDDDDLANNDTDPVVLTGIGKQGGAVYMLQVRLVAEVDPLEALRTAIHGASITVNAGMSLAATGAPVSSDGLLVVDMGATITGDVEADSLSNGGTITGTVSVPSPKKGMPDAGVFDMYRNLATPIAPPSLIEKQVLAPGFNPWGATNPDGVYFISMASGTLDITDSRINGTLVVQANGGVVRLNNSVFLHKYDVDHRNDYPVLIVDGDVELLYFSDAMKLSEVTLATNFNPAGAPYGDTDVLQDDEYDNEIQGLVHLTGNLRLRGTARVRGVVICEGAVSADENNEIVYDAELYANPPVGYTMPPKMVVAQGSWQQVVD